MTKKIEEKTKEKIGHKAEAKTEPAKKKEEKKMAKKPAKEDIKEKEPKAGGRREGAKGPFEWVEFKPKEIEEVIINLANSGYSASQMGMVLRDQYGIPSVKKFLGKKIQQFLKEHKLLPEVPFELLSLIRKSVQIEKHLKENKKDTTAKMGLQLTVSKIRRLVKYYRKVGKLSPDWKYTSERAALLIK